MSLAMIMSLRMGRAEEGSVGEVCVEGIVLGKAVTFFILLRDPLVTLLERKEHQHLKLYLSSPKTSLHSTLSSAFPLDLKERELKGYRRIVKEEKEFLFQSISP